MDQPQPVMLVVMDPTVNIQQLCRLCGSKTEEYNRLNIFDNTGSMNLPLTIKSCVGLEISEIDNLPKFICVPCLSNVDNFSKFKSNCEYTARLLLQLCNQQVQYNSMNVSNANLTPSLPGLNPIAFTENSINNYGNQSTKHTPTVRNPEIVPETSFIQQCTSSTLSDVYNNCQSNDTMQSNVIEHVNLDFVNNVSVSSHNVQEKTGQEKCKITSKSSTKKSSKRIKKFRRAKTPVYTCDFCSRKFTWRNSITEHMVAKHLPPSDRLPCKLCDKDFKNKDCLKMHVIQVHEKKFNIYCDYCGQGFLTAIRFEDHVRDKHTNERPFQCSQCNKKYASKYQLTAHILSGHNTEKKTEFCNICNKSFAKLKNHMKLHLVPREERCKRICVVCNLRFKTDSALKKHLITHSGEKPFECEVCGKCFATSSSLQQHKIFHTGERKHICEVCGSAFALLCNLRIHKLSVHEGIKKFKCADCDKSYTQNKNLNIHLKKTGHTRISNKKIYYDAQYKEKDITDKGK